MNTKKTKKEEEEEEEENIKKLMKNARKIYMKIKYIKIPFFHTLINSIYLSCLSPVSPTYR